MNKENHNRCFESETGSPTLTIEQESGHRMIPYSSFETAHFDGGQNIEILFSGWILEIQGDQLEDIWEKLQMLDVKILRVSPGGGTEDCSITRLSLKSGDAETVSQEH